MAVVLGAPGSRAAQGFSPAIRPRFAALKRCAALLLVLAGTACDRVTGDSAARVVSAVRDGADRLKRSPSDTLVLSVALPSWPGGCPEGFRVEWRADSDRLPGLGVICDASPRGFAAVNYRAAVRIPRPLQIAKQKGEPITVGLRKRADGAIEVVALQ